MMVDLKKISLVSSGINVLLKPNKVFGMPRHILTEFTNQCNLNCKICPRVNNIPSKSGTLTQRNLNILLIK